MGKFIIKPTSNNQYRFILEAENGKTILTSETYTSKASCLNGVDSVKENARYDSRYDRLISSNEKLYFNLKAGNGQIIGTSEMYETISGRENGIVSVKNNAPGASVIEE